MIADEPDYSPTAVRIMNKLIIVAIIVIVVGILSYMGVRSQGAFDHVSLMETIKLMDGGPLEADLIFDTAAFELVHAGLGDMVPFLTEMRSGSIAAFPCQNCHSIPLEQMTYSGENRKQRAHWDIQLQHSGTEVMECFTCHNRSNLDQLRSLSGHPISFDRSFELCSQCHTTQYKDWMGGAHGKNLSGWRPPRVAQTCVGCHNPHQPAIESRWPSRWTGR